MTSARTDGTSATPSLGYRGLFYAGVVAVTLGVMLHLPMYVEAREMGFRLVGMPIDWTMGIGMGLIVVGLTASIAGLIPRQTFIGAPSQSRVRVRALDEVPGEL